MKQSFKEYLIAEKSPFANLYMSVVPDTSSGICDDNKEDEKDDESKDKKDKDPKLSKRDKQKKKADEYNKELLNFMKAHQIANS